MALVYDIDQARPPRRRGRGRTFDPATIRAMYGPPRNLSPKQIVAELRCSIGTVVRALKNRDLQKTDTRSPGGPGTGRGAQLLRHDHPALSEKRTLFPTMVMDPTESVLKSGQYSAKIGGTILKGLWKGFPVYTVTLEERATCPTSCRHWASCYGNGTPFARRFRHGDELEWRIEREIAALELAHRGGFVVRLHNLGDFYSWGYVELWNTLLDRHPALHCFGYTARIDVERDIIARKLAHTVRARWPRFAIRFSNAPIDRCATVSIEHPFQKPEGAIVCPAQLHASESCSTCGLCWSTTAPIAFLQH